MASIFVVFIALGYLLQLGANGESLNYTNVTLPTQVIVKSVEVEATGTKVDVGQRKFNTSGDTPYINCSRQSTNAGFMNFNWKWANGTTLSTDDGAVSERIPSTVSLDGGLIIGMLKFPNFGTKGGRNAGQYRCEYGSASAMPVVKSAPVATMSEKDYRSVMEGDTLTQTCTVAAYPTPDVIWKKNNEIVTTDGGRIEFSNGNKTMTIKELKKEDAGLYVCSANNTLGRGEAYIKLRVKDRLAALWPFLGILAEVTVLVIIIMLYEKKRAAQKRNQEDQDTAEVKDDRNANDSDVRHRQVKT